MQAVIIFDADNTLWDTNAVFHTAQLAMLEQLVPPEALEEREQQIVQLRALDRALSERLGLAEYDFHLLAIAKAYMIWAGVTLAEALNRTLKVGTVGLPADAIAAVRSGTQAFKQHLRDIPPLYADTYEVLAALRALNEAKGNELSVVVCSEGNEKRLWRIITHYKMEEKGLIDGVYIAPKSPSAMIQARQIGLNRLNPADDGDPLIVVVGDSLHRDIRFGNQIHAVTIYKPADYMGLETPASDIETPSQTIHTLLELLPILHTYGLRLPMNVSAVNSSY